MNQTITDEYEKGISNLKQGIAHALRQVREDAGLSQKDLAEMAGFNQSVVSRIETCRHEGIDLCVVYRLFKCMDVDIELNFLFDDDEEDMFANE